MKHELGNVLFLILIAVILFAVLAYNVTRSSRSGSNDVGSESAGLIAGRILQFGSYIESTILKMRLRGCQDIEVSFDSPLYGTDYLNANSPVNKTCHVYDPAGGGATTVIAQQFIPGNPAEPFFTGSVAVSGLGTNQPELMMIVHNVGLPVCHQIMKRMSRDFIPTDAEGVAATSHFVGSYSTTGTVGDEGINNGQTTGCFSDGTGNFIHAYHVLLVR